MPRKAGQKEATCNAIKRMYDEGLSDQEMADKLGLKLATIRSYRADMGIYNLNITKKWLEESGIGDEWDEACIRLRKAAKR